MATASVLEYSRSKPIPAVLCSNCGSYCPVFSGATESGDENQRRIAELEAQVNVLKKSASDAAVKATDYQDELRRIKNTSPISTTSAVPPTPGLSRFGSFLGGRKLSSSSTSTNEPASASIIRTNSLSQKETELAAQLAQEQEARQKAEGKVSQMSHELEDLSVQLFQQANEMVAAERRARAKLEERVVILERRDVEKRERLERLERALRRIDRVKNLLMAQDELPTDSLGGNPVAKRVKT